MNEASAVLTILHAWADSDALNRRVAANALLDVDPIGWGEEGHATHASLLTAMQDVASLHHAAQVLACETVTSPSMLSA